MMHGAPCPASINFGATSVARLLVCRPLWLACYQNLTEALLPDDMR